MKNVWMLCAAGVSTHVFAEKVQKALDADSLDIAVSAHSTAEAKEKGSEPDLLLLTPQVQMDLDLIRALFPAQRVEVIDFNAFATLDVDAAVAQIKAALAA